MDLISIGDAQFDCKTSIMLTSGMVPTARSGIAEALAGDARDPHGDLHQTYSNPNQRSTGGRSIEGNVYWPSGRGDDNTIINPMDLTSGSSVFIDGDPSQNNSIQRTIAAGFPLPDVALLAENVTLTAANILQANTVDDILYRIDLVSKAVQLLGNGILVSDFALTANSGLMGSTQSKVHLLQSTSGENRFSGQVFAVQVWKGIAIDSPVPPAAVPFKQITGSAAAVNADPWKVGKGVAV